MIVRLLTSRVVFHLDSYADFVLEITSGNETITAAFSALHGMPARTSDEKGVCLSVRLSVC